MPSRLAIVMPTLDEASTLERNLPAALELADELVVSDGGSRDGTCTVARRSGAAVVVGPPGRGRQLNRGAAAVRSDILLFLHADTRLPAGAPAAVRQAIAAGAVGGGFLCRFASRRRVFALGSRLVNVRTRLTRAPLGDQAQFAARSAFASLGGFREWEVLEDLDFIRRLKRRGPIAVLPLAAETSARRFVAGGIVRTVAVNWLIWGLYFAGVAPPRLARFYRQVR